MRYVYAALGWIGGMLLVLIALSMLFSSPLAAFPLFGMAALVLPPARQWAYSKTHATLSSTTRKFLLGIGSIAFITLLSVDMERGAAREAALAADQSAQRVRIEREKTLDYYRQHAAIILADIRTAMGKQDFNAALALSGKYLVVSGDTQLTQLHAQARTGQILEQLKTIRPSMRYQANKDLYAELVKLNPGIQPYADKLAFYSAKLTEQAEADRRAAEKLEREQQQRVAAFGEPPIASSWDGTYAPVERYLRQVANDPDSLKMSGCTDLYYTSKGWLVGCDFRARNGFGGMVRQSNWFTIVHGNVVKMEDATSHSRR